MRPGRDPGERDLPSILFVQALRACGYGFASVVRGRRGPRLPDAKVGLVHLDARRADSSCPPAIGAPFVIAGVLKAVYDLALFAAFRRVPLPESAPRVPIRPRPER